MEKPTTPTPLHSVFSDPPSATHHTVRYKPHDLPSAAAFSVVGLPAAIPDLHCDSQIYANPEGRRPPPISRCSPLWQNKLTFMAATKSTAENIPRLLYVNPNLGFSLEETPDSSLKKIITRLGPRSMTALHVAALKGHVQFLKNMVELMNEEDLEIRDDRDYTALEYAVIMGNLEAATTLINKNWRLPNLLDAGGDCPLGNAVIQSGLVRNAEMVWYLASMTVNEQVFTTNLVHALVITGYVDVLLYLLERFPGYLSNSKSNAAALLSELAETPLNFLSGCRFGFWQRCIYSIIPVIGRSFELPFSVRSNAGDPHKDCSAVLHWFRRVLFNISKVIAPDFIWRIQEKKRRHHCAIELVNLVCGQIIKMDAIEEGFMGYQILYRATTSGIIEILRICFQLCPELIWVRLKDKDYSLLEAAVKNRHDEIFKFLIRDKSCFAIDSSFYYEVSTTLLHKTATLAPSLELLSVSGVALQMQREIQWFKAVEKLMYPTTVENTNEENLTAWELFKREHKQLAEAGEKWMKDTSDSCMIVSTLITTVVFAAAFTVPGGNDSNDGVPIFLWSKAFLVFAVSDALALFSSLTSLLMFLSILTARYAEEDFLKSLPERLIIGLASLFFAIATMMIAFAATLFIVLSKRLQWVFGPIILLSFFPVSIFGLLKLPLFIQMIQSTYGSTLLPSNVSEM
ncbi:uncharacterized protein LOC21402697 isoform X2 [Morus notabilis]|uniref:uncharacterized protein LOC21402697 isoform X2 n=1 Tax=Morus notabilis TaxID=981085 RepID=UPI000CED088A|nr:uncharacterized protein LOC21402697 isoform X2 [Morus notabilis]